MRQIYWAYRRKYVTSMQQAMRAHRDLYPFPLATPVPHTQTPMLTYVALLQSMGAMPGVSLQPMQRRLGGPNLYDSEDTEGGRLLAAQQPTVAQPECLDNITLTPLPVWRQTMGRSLKGILRLRCQGLKSTPGAYRHRMGNGIAVQHTGCMTGTC